MTIARSTTARNLSIAYRLSLGLWKHASSTIQATTHSVTSQGSPFKRFMLDMVLVRV